MSLTVKEDLMACESICCRIDVEKLQSQHRIRYFTILAKGFKQAVEFLSFPCR